MKRVLCLFLMSLALLALCIAMAACGETPVPPADTPQASAGESSPATVPEETMDPSSETTLETPSETTPAAETQPDDPLLLSVAALDDQAAASGYFPRPSHCEAGVSEDADLGRILRISSDGITSAGTAAPEAFFSMQKFAEALGKEVPDITAYPYLVLKVRAGDVWSRLFSLYGGEKLTAAKPKDESRLMCAYLKDTDDWQYIYFDLSSLQAPLHTLFIRFEAGAGKNGESIDIAEFRFCATKEEASALCGRDVYELGDRDNTLRVISYNIWVGGGTNTTIRADILREVIDTYKPDSIGMQEVTLAWKSEFERFVFNDSYAGVGEGRSDAYEACLLYYRVDKYELVDSGTFWLSDTPDVKGSSFAEALYPRICTWAHLRDRETGFEYVHINTHLDHLGSSKGGDELRGKQIQVLLEFIRRFEGKPLVMTGDFNTTPTNGKGSLRPAYAYITGNESFVAPDGSTITAPFADARLTADKTVDKDHTATMTKYYEEGGDPTYPPIDYHFYTPTHFHPLSYETFIFERDGVPLSDHLALICEYRILAEE